MAGFKFWFCPALLAQEMALAWDLIRQTGILSYQIYRAMDSDSSYTLLGIVQHPDSTYLDQKIERDVHYSYVATSIDQYGNESGFSNRIDTTLQSIVPVELCSFSAQITHANDILLEWTTTAECRNYKFEEQRLSAGRFESIGSVQSPVSDGNPHSYRFLDTHLADNTYYYRLVQIDFDGTTKFSNTIEVRLALALTAHLFQNYPNPFNGSTEISYDLPTNGQVELTIYNELGHEVKRLVNHFQLKGKHSVKWDAKDYLGREVGSGLYYYKIKAAPFTGFREMMVVK